MNPPLVSIIIPLYNSEKYIAETVKSALAQTWADKEIIIIDDGSTDNSLAIAKTFESENLKVFHQQNKGASAARNYGLKMAGGEYIQFLDADDLLSHNKIEKQLQALNDYPNRICTGPTVFFFDNTDNFDQIISGTDDTKKNFNPLEYLVKLYGVELGGMSTIHSWLTPKVIIDKVGPWNEELTVDDDGEYFCRVILASAGVVECNNTFNFYRKHVDKTNLSAQLSLKAYQSMLLSTRLKHQHLLDSGIERILANKIFSKIYWRMGIASYPQYLKFSRQARKLANKHDFSGAKYYAGPISTVASKIVGWRLIRILTFIKYRL